MSVEANTVNNGKRRQSRVQKRLLETTGIASLLVCFGSLVSPADAACGPNNNPTYNAPVTCTTTNANANLTMAGPSTVTVTDAPGTQDAVRSQVNGNTGNATMTLNDVTVINNDLTYPSIGVYVLIADFTTPTGNGVLNMTGTNNVTTANGTTVEVNVRGTGSATMNLSGTLNVTSLVTNTDDNDGIESTTHNGGASTINMAQASGVVSVKGGNGILIDSLASGGNISGNIGSGMTINLDNTIAGANNALNPNSGIYTFTQATGTINLTTGAAINTTGNRADGIRAVAVRGQVSVTNTGAIATTGTNSRGIEIATTAGPNGPGGPITANNSGAITTSGLTSSGILATSTDGNLSITNSGAINTSGQQSHGIQATTANAGTSTVSTAAAINARGLQSVGIYALGSTSSVTVDAGGSVSGGWEPSSVSPPSAGVAIGSTGGAKTLTNNGTIGALSDRAIAELDRFVVGVASPLTIVNNGNITGYIQLGGGDATFRNLTPNSFDIRHFADTNGDGIRDTKRVAISRFGTGNDTFLNETNGTVRLAPVAGAAVTETIGYAVPTTGIDSRPLEASFYDFNREGLLQGQLTNLETFDNAGTIDLRGSVVGNTLLITGGPGVDGVLLPGNGVFISDGGKLLVNAMLNAGIPLAGQTNSYSDMLIVDSTQLGAGGPTAITVTNVGGSGALTPGNGIEVVEVRNKTASVAGAFALNGDYVTKDSQQAVVGGAFAYTLHHNGVGGDTADGNWYLRSQIVPTPPGPTPPNPPNPPEPPQPRYQPGVPIYEVYPQNLLALAAVPTMQQRVGNRYWTEPAPAPETVFCKDASQNFQCPVTGAQAQYYAGAAVGNRALIEDQRAIWGRIEGSHASIEPAITTSGTDYDTNVWNLQAGLDGLLHEAEDGSKLIGGITVHFGQASSDVTSFFGDGSIDTNGYGFGGTLTWYDQSGFYVDGQAQLTWFDSDLTSKALNLATPTLVDGNGGFGYALSVETGKKFDLNETWTFTPQAQLAYANVDFDSFTDVFGANVSLGSGDSLIGRLGISADRDQSWTDEDGKTRRSHLYGIASLYYQFLDATRVEVSGVSFETRPDRLWGGLGLGGTYNWNDDKYSVFGEVSLNSSLENFGDSYALAGTAGFRVRW